MNLTAVDTAVLYDSESAWIARRDHIGQTQQVYVSCFVTENGVEEHMLERAAQKLCQDQLVTQQGNSSQKVILIVPPAVDTFLIRVGPVYLIVTGHLYT